VPPRAQEKGKKMSLIEKPRILLETPSNYLINTWSDGVQLDVVPGKMVFGPKIDLRSNITQAQVDFLQKNVSVVKICLKDTPGDITKLPRTTRVTLAVGRVGGAWGESRNQGVVFQHISHH